MRKFIIISLCALAVLGCKKNDSAGYLDFENVVVTGDYSELTSTHVKLSASFSPLYYMDVEEVGVIISTSNSVLDLSHYTYYRNSYDVGPEYTCEFSYLSPGTTYYYRAFMRYDYLFSYKTEYGDIKTFTTLPQ